MPLTLITGPANSAKAGAILDRARAAAGRSPLLVVPGGADVDHYRRELAASGTVLGVRVVVFDRLLDEVVAQACLTQPVAGRLVRLQIAAAAAGSVKLSRLGEVSRTPGFAAGLARFADELASHRIDPARFAAAIRRWAAGDRSREGYAADLAALVRADSDAQDRCGRWSRERVVAAALDGLRERPALWDGTPVLLYGYDDLGRLQQDVVESLAGTVGAEVTVALSYEAGREVFAARARLFEDLKAIAAESVVLPADAGHYAPAARETLHHVERGLLEATAHRCAQAGGVRALHGGSERAELELAAHEIAALIAAGEPAESIAVVHRELEGRADLVRQVFRDAGVPVALQTTVRASHTQIGRGIKALLACAFGDGGGDDLVTYLRAPGVLRNIALADEFEQLLRRTGIVATDDALAEWERRHWPVGAVSKLRTAAGQGLPQLCAELERRVGKLLGALGPALAPVFAADSGEPRAAARIIKALRAMSGLPTDLQPAAGEIEGLLDELTFTAGDAPRTGLVTVSTPQRLRARRVGRLYCLGLVEGVFPASARPEPFLGDEDRRELAEETGVVLRLHEDSADVERLFFYAEVSRPETELVVGWHDAGADGKARVRSPFLDELAHLLPENWIDGARFRPSGAVGRPDRKQGRQTRREALRHAAATGPRRVPRAIAAPVDPVVTATFAERTRFSASSLERWIACPAGWLVDSCLRPDELAPESEHLARGRIVHGVLERVVPALGEAPGGIAAQTAGERRRVVEQALAEVVAAEPAISLGAERRRLALRQVEVDLLVYLEWLAHAQSPFVPTDFELKFGDGDDDELPPATLAAGLTLSGRIDRIDRAPGGVVIIYDYKGTSDPALRKSWIEQGKLQLPLYMRAVRELLDLRVAGAFYQPVGNRRQVGPRGVVTGGTDAGFRPTATDVLTDEELEQLLDDAAALTVAAAGELRAGAIEPRPGTCSADGCRYPVICRCIT